MQTLIKIKKSIENSIIRIIKYREHKNKNFIINFLYEGNREIKTPKLSFIEAFFGYGIFAKRSFYLMSRPYSEILLRNIIYTLFKDKYLNSNLSIIDIVS